MLEFILIEPFQSHHFTLQNEVGVAGTTNYKPPVVGTVESYVGNNEQQMFQYEEIKLWFSEGNNVIYHEKDEDYDDEKPPFQERYESRYTDFCPFFKHENPQYLIQKESIYIES